MARHLDQSLYRETKKASASVDAVRGPLERGADVNRRFKYGTTPLWEAAFYGHFEIAQLLINAGADPRIVADDGSGPLHWAAAGAFAEIVDLLLYHGADPNERRNSDGHGAFSPLFRAIAAGCKTCVAKLVRAGADINLRYFDQDAIQNAQWKGQHGIALFLTRSRRVSQNGK